MIDTITRVHPSFVCLSFIFAVCLGIENVVIKNEQDFIDFAYNVSQGSSLVFNAVLINDLDFSALPLSYPVGGFSCTPFSGVFDGNNHTISNVNMTNIVQPNYFSALFCSASDAIIQNLIIDDSCLFVGEMSASVLLSVHGSLTLRNVVNKATVIGITTAGGFIHGISGCTNCTILIDNCENHGDVSTTRIYSTGGFISCIDGNEDISITISNTINAGNVSGGNYDAGFIGEITNNNNISFYFENSKNEANCSSVSSSYSVVSSGFIAYFNSNDDSRIVMDNAINNGAIVSHSDSGSPYDLVCAGGLIAFADESSELELTIQNCINNGVIDVAGSTASAGGMIGNFVDSNSDAEVSLINNTNNGMVKTTNGVNVGGFIAILRWNDGLFLKMLSNINNADIQNEGNINASVGGLIGEIVEPHCSIEMIHGINNGVISSGTGVGDVAGGLIGSIDGPCFSVTIQMTHCENNGTVSGSEGQCGGLIGGNPDEDIMISLNSCINKGAIIASRAYGIAHAIYEAKAVISLGFVQGPQPIPFWDYCNSSISRLFCYGTPSNCSYYSTLIEKVNDEYVIAEI